MGPSFEKHPINFEYQNLARTILVHSVCILMIFAPALQAEELAEAATPDKNAPETQFFFGDSDAHEKKGDGVYNNAFENRDAESSGISEESQNGQDRWIDEDISPMFPELQILDEMSTKKSLERMRKARKNYSQARRSLKRGDSLAASEQAKLNLEGTRYDWERLDRKANLERRKRGIHARARMEAVSYLIKGIQELDAIKSPTVLKSKAYISLKADFYREYVKQQFRSRNLHLCIDILERYLKLRPEHKREPEAHRLLAACYRHQEVIADRSRDTKARLHFRSAKNKHLIDFALLAYGKDSPQFAIIKKKVDNDQIEVYNN